MLKQEMHHSVRKKDNTNFKLGRNTEYNEVSKLCKQTFKEVKGQSHIKVIPSLPVSISMFCLYGLIAIIQIITNSCFYGVNKNPQRREFQL